MKSAQKNRKERSQNQNSKKNQNEAQGHKMKPEQKIEALKHRSNSTKTEQKLRKDRRDGSTELH